ncbi:MAG: hypothetical protein Q9210_007111, partial [Variospora velana]
MGIYPKLPTLPTLPTFDLKASEPLDQHRVIVFRRLVRFYDNFLLLSALTGDTCARERPAIVKSGRWK